MIKSNPNDIILQNDIKNMLGILYTFLFILIGFSCSMFKIIYTVLNQSRLNEFYILNTLGITKGRIKKIVFLEVINITLIAIVLSTILGTVASQAFMQHYNFDNSLISFSSILTIIIGTFVLMIIIINSTINKIFSGDIKKKFYLSKAGEYFRIIMGVLGISTALLCIFNFSNYIFEKFNFTITNENATMLNDVIFWLGVVMSIDFIILMLIKLLKKVAEHLKINSLFIASQQLLFNFKKIKGVIVSFTISIFMIVGMLGFYDSVTSSVEKYIDKTVSYDYLLVLNEESKISEANLKDYIKTNIQHGEFETSLNMIVKDASNKEFILTGIDESFNRFEPILLENKNVKSIFNKDENNLKVFISEKAFRDKILKPQEKINVSIVDSKLELEIEDLHKNINTSEIYISKELLSSIIYGEGNHYNVIYFKGYPLSAVNKVIDFLNVKNYELNDINNMKDTMKKRVINGTEVIEVFLYIIVFFTISLIINLFILSLNSRAKEYSVFNILGISNLKIISAMIIEVLIIFFSGSVLGWNFGFEFVKGSAYYMKSSFVFPLLPSLPVGELSILLVICFCLLMASITLIGNFSIRNKELFLKKYE
jgi:hypothetical protein